MWIVSPLRLTSSWLDVVLDSLKSFQTLSSLHQWSFSIFLLVSNIKRPILGRQWRASWHTVKDNFLVGLDINDIFKSFSTLIVLHVVVVDLSPHSRHLSDIPFRRRNWFPWSPCAFLQSLSLGALLSDELLLVSSKLTCHYSFHWLFGLTHNLTATVTLARIPSTLIFNRLVPV